MTGIATSRNLSMDTAGVIGRGSGAGKSTIMDAAAVRAFADAYSTSEVDSAIADAISGIDLSDYLPLTGGTLTGALTVEHTIKSCQDIGFLLGRFLGPGFAGLIFYDTDITQIYGSAGVCRLQMSGVTTQLGSDAIFGFASGEAFGTSIDTPQVRAAAGTTAFRNGTAAQSVQVSHTYTDATTLEYLEVSAGKVLANSFDILSRRGSVGGSNRQIRIGSLAADQTTFTGIIVSTTGTLTIGPATGGQSNIKIVGSYSSGNSINLNNAQAEWANGAAANPIRLLTNISGVRIANSNFVDLIPISGGLRLVVPASYNASQNSAAITGTDAALTCGTITASGAITQQNGATATLHQLHNNYTSDTNREYLELSAGSTLANSFDILSRVGSAGGSNRQIRIGSLAADGTTFSGVICDTAGVLQTSSHLRIGSATRQFTTAGSTGLYYHAGTIGTPGRSLYLDVRKAGMCNDGVFAFSASGDSGGGVDAAIGRNTTGVIEINSGTAGTYRDLILRNLTASGEITQTPPSSVTLSTNGQFAVEMTSNTAGNLVYRGSDGTTRRFAFTVS